MTSRSSKRATKKLDVDAAWVITESKRVATKRTRDGMARFAVPSQNAFGVTAPDMRKLAQRIGKDHELAQPLRRTGWYEARTVAVLIDEPEWVTPAQMNRWCRDFDSWAICDSECFHLFDRTPHAFAKIAEWAKRKREFERRAVFALTASVGLQVRDADEAQLLRCLPLIDGIGRRNPVVRARSQALARRLARSRDATERWIGRNALREWKLPVPG